MTGLNNNLSNSDDKSKDFDNIAHTMTTGNTNNDADAQTPVNAEDEQLRREAEESSAELQRLVEETRSHDITADETEKDLTEIEVGTDELLDEARKMDAELTAEEIAAANASSQTEN